MCEYTNQTKWNLKNKIFIYIKEETLIHSPKQS